jgi:hypothetical protein
MDSESYAQSASRTRVHISCNLAGGWLPSDNPTILFSKLDNLIDTISSGIMRLLSRHTCTPVLALQLASLRHPDGHWFPGGLQQCPYIFTVTVSARRYPFVPKRRVGCHKLLLVEGSLGDEMIVIEIKASKQGREGEV